MSKNVLMRSPVGLGEYVFIKNPYTQHDPDGEFKANLIVDPDDGGVTEFLTEIKAASNGGHLPYTKNDDGTVTVKFKSKYRPKVADAHGHYYDEEDVPMVGNGSKIRIAYNMKPWEFGGKNGVKLYLQGVQILDLIPYEGSMFDAEEGAESEPEPTPDDDMPF